MSHEQSLALKRASALARLDYPSFGLRDAIEHISGLNDAISAHLQPFHTQLGAVHKLASAAAEGNLIARQVRDLNNEFSAVDSSIHAAAVRIGLQAMMAPVRDRLAERLDELRATVDSLTTDPAFPLANTIGRLIQHDSPFDDLKSLARSASVPSVALQRTMDEAAAAAARLAAPFDDLQAFARSIVGPSETFERMVDRLTTTAADGSLSSDDDDVAVRGEPESCDADMAEAPTPVDTLLAGAVADVDGLHEAKDLEGPAAVRLACELVVAIYTLPQDLRVLARREGLLAADGSLVVVNVTDWLITRVPAAALRIAGDARTLAAQIEALYAPSGVTRSGYEGLSREQCEWIIDLAQQVRRLLLQKPIHG